MTAVFDTFKKFKGIIYAVNYCQSYGKYCKAKVDSLYLLMESIRKLL